MAQKSEKGQRLNVKLPPTLLSAFKAEIALSGSTISDVIRVLLASWTAERRVARQEAEEAAAEK